MSAPDLGRCAVVSCHVERALDDRVWSAFERLLAARPAGFVVTPFMRPPHAPSGEDTERWLVRARRAAELAPLAHHTHWGGPSQARPAAEVDAAAAVREEAEWLRAHGLAPRFFCGGGWFLDARLAETLAELGYVDCTGTTFRQSYLAAGAPRLQVGGPCRLRLPGGATLLEVPATHSPGLLARGFLGLRGLVHLHFHDWELVDPTRVAALHTLLRLLRLRRRPLDLAQLAEQTANSPILEWPQVTIGT
jgi:hypothetical protein